MSSPRIESLARVVQMRTVALLKLFQRFPLVYLLLRWYLLRQENCVRIPWIRTLYPIQLLELPIHFPHRRSIPDLQPVIMNMSLKMIEIV